MRQLTVSFCASIDQQSELYEEVNDVLALYSESDRLYEQNFEMPADEGQQCMALQLSVEDEFYDSLKRRLADTIRSRHGCSVVVGEYKDGRPDVVHGECQFFEDDTEE